MLRALALLLALPAHAADTPAPDTPAPDTQAPAIAVATVTEQILRDRVIASGLVAAVERVQVQPLIEGQQIETLAAEVGDTVAAGQVLARLSAASLTLQRSELVASQAAAVAAVAQGEAQLAEARATADEARRVADRTQALRAQGSAAQSAAETADANAASAEARARAAAQGLRAAGAQVALADARIANIDLQLERTEVIAPVAGTVVERSALVGTIASAQGGAMFTLIRDGALELRADLAEADVMRLLPGQAARITPVSGPALTGTVRLVEPQVDETTRLGRVRIALDDPAALRPGMFARAEIVVAERSAPAIPATALGRDAEGSFVMVEDGGILSRAAVTPGIRDGGTVEAQGLIPGQRIVARAGVFVRAGDRITPVAP